MLTAIFKDWARRAAQPVALTLGSLGLTPNMLTVIGFALSVGVAVILWLGHLSIGGFLVLVVSAFDMLDGALARATRQTTRFGAFLDSTLDRYSEAALLTGLLMFLVVQGDQLGSLLAIAALVGSFMVSYTRARAEGLGLSCEVGWLARPERIIILGLGLIFGLAVPALAVVAVLANFTAGQRVAHVWRATREQ